MSSDHQPSLALAVRLRRVPPHAPVALWRELAQAAHALFTREILPHFGLEESRLFPALEQAGGGELVRRALEEHAALRAGFERFAALEASRDPQLAAALLAWSERLAAHIRFEERELFAFAQLHLPAAALAAVAAARPHKR